VQQLGTALPKTTEGHSIIKRISTIDSFIYFSRKKSSDTKEQNHILEPGSKEDFELLDFRLGIYTVTIFSAVHVKFGSVSSSKKEQYRNNTKVKIATAMNKKHHDPTERKTKKFYK